MAMSETSTNHFPDWGNLIVGIALAVSPWVFGFAGEQPASGAAVIGGVIVALVAIAALVSFAEWEEWLNMLLGAAIVVTPFVAGFAPASTAGITMIVAGLLVMILAGSEIWSVRHDERAYH